MPNRIIKESVCTSDNLDKLSWFAEVVFYRLIVTVDDYGRMDARPPILRARLFPLKSVTDKQIADALQSMRSAGIVDLYVVDGRPYLQMRTWAKHQRLRTTREKYPAPPDEDEGEDAGNEGLPQVAASCGKLPQTAASRRELRPESNVESESESESEAEAEANARAREGFPPPPAAADTPGEIIGIDGTDISGGMARYAEVERLIKRYRLAGNDATLTALLEDAQRYGLPAVEDALSRAALADTRGGLSVRFYRRFLLGNEPDAAKPGAPPMLRRGKEERKQTTSKATVDLYADDT